MKTSIGLVEYCKAQLGKPYWWGTFGHNATESLLRQKSAQYPEYYKASDFKKQYGEKVHDCSGLIKGYFFCDTPNAPYNPIKYDSRIDGGIKISNCKLNGTMETMPDIAGILVFMPRTRWRLCWKR